MTNCENCPHLKKFAAFYEGYTTLKCDKYKSDSGECKEIERYHIEDTKIKKPFWCTYDEEEHTTDITIAKVKPIINFSNIKKGDILHFPPYRGKERKNVTVTDKYDYILYYTDNETHKYGTLLSSDVICKFISKK